MTEDLKKLEVAIERFEMVEKLIPGYQWNEDTLTLLNHARKTLNDAFEVKVLTK